VGNRYRSVNIFPEYSSGKVGNIWRIMFKNWNSRISSDEMRWDKMRWDEMG
jgi:hypothetical protein